MRKFFIKLLVLEEMTMKHKHILFMLTIAIGWMAVMPSTAVADRMDSVRNRAECAQLEMEKALGHKVSQSKWNACKSVPNAVHKQPKSHDNFADVQPPVPIKVTPLKARPAWVDRPPRSKGILYGVGSGKNAQPAFNRALVMIAAQLQVTIRSSITQLASESHKETIKNGWVKNDETNAHQYIQSTSRMIVRGNIKNARLEDQWTDHKKGVTWVLASLDIAAIERKKQALVNAVFLALAQATNRLNLRLHKDGVLDQQMLRDLVAVIGDVRALGRSSLGRDARSAWAGAFRRFRENVRRLAECMDVDGTYILPNGRQVPVADAPRLPPGSRIELNVSCRGIPIVNARIKPWVKAGLVQIPETLYTDAKGKMVIKVGTGFGSGIRLGFTHDMKSEPGAFWLGSMRPSRKGMVEFGAWKPATIAFHVTGGTPKENKKFGNELKSFARKWWGVTIAAKKPLLKGQIRLRFGNLTHPGTRVMQPVEVDIAVTLTKGGVLLDKTVKTGFLAQTKEKARANALRNLVRRLGRMKLSGILDTSVRVK